MTEPYSDLQVDSQLQFPKYPSPNLHEEDAKAGNSAYIYSDKIATEEQPNLEVAHPNPPQGKRKRICGLAAKTFWIVVAIIAIIVIAAAIGGGVAGSRAGKSNSTKSAAGSISSQTTSASNTSPSSSSSSAPITSYPSTTTTISISTSTTIGPSETLLVDCPSSNNTLYSPPSTNQLYRKICSLSYLSNGLNAIQQSTPSLDTCIAACAAYNVQNATQIADGSNNVCNAVCWRATITGDDYPGVCFGFTTTNSSGAFVYNDDARCDSAALVNQNF